MAIDLVSLSLPMLALLALVSTAVIWQGSAVLEEKSETLAVHYGLPPIVQGALVAAVGSSFPELSTTVISALLHGEFSLGVGAIVGSAVFNILVIPGVSGLVTDGKLEANRDIAFKEALFYMVAVAALFSVFTLAVVYNRQGPDAPLVGTLTRPLAGVLVLLYALYIFIQYQDTREYTPTRESDAGVAIVREWALLAGSLVVILVGVEGLVQAALGFRRVFETPAFLWGVTVIAAGTSLPDTLVSVRAAGNGGDITSLSNVLGSNVFDLLIAIPAGVLIAGSAPVDFAIAGPMMTFLIFATVLLFAFLRTDLALSSRESGVLLLTYVVFVLWMALETVGVVTGVLPT